MSGSSEQFLVAHTGRCAVAIPLSHTSEVMRPLPITPLAGSPAFVLGLATIRGKTAPVISTSALLGGEVGKAPTRFVCLRSNGRLVALALEHVDGIRSFPNSLFETLPPLLSSAESEKLVERIGTLDAQLLVVLKSGRIVPDNVWKHIEEGSGAPA